MRNIKLFIVALAFAFMLPSVAFAETFEHNAGKIQFELPENWKTEQDGDLLMANPKDESVVLMFMVLDAKDLDTATDAVDKELSKQFTHIKAGEAEEITLNGMKGAVVEATAKADGQPIELGIMILNNKSKMVMVLGFAAAGQYKKHEKVVTSILTSLKPM